MKNFTEDDQFFTTTEVISSVPVWDSRRHDDSVSYSSNHDCWTKNPTSVQDRRSKFLKWMGLNMDYNFTDWEDSLDIYTGKLEIAMDRITKNSGAVLSTLDYQDHVLSCHSDETLMSIGSGAMRENFRGTIEKFDIETEFMAEELGQDETPLRHKPRDRLVDIEDFRMKIMDSPFVYKPLCREAEEAQNLIDVKKKVKRGWLQKLGAAAHITDRHGTAASKSSNLEKATGERIQRIHAHAHKKRSKELSSLHNGQELLAHEGSISTTKFSLDGHYLATAGEDKIVRVWKVTEEERLDKFENSDACRPFTVDHLSKSALLKVEKEKKSGITGLGRSSNLTCTIFPPKVFWITEKPLHEFQGHGGEVLDLSWSKQGYLLSSSVDMTVRLWQLGCEKCLGVFSHNNYVTCISFNPVDDDYFISGSIDGKVRIWQVPGCKVVDYIDIREIVTAVCYRPDGKGGIVGSMTGNCHFYDIRGNHLQLAAQVCVQGKKKLPGKRITGFEFCPSDQSKVMVTSADSLVRILCGSDVICKFRGRRNSGSQISASFTSDGKHIISASEDSNVLIWNYNSQEKISWQAKNIGSYESFFSRNSSIAIPWCSTNKQSMPGTFTSPMLGSNLKNGQNLDRKLLIPSPDYLSPSTGFLLESSPKGSATWPEEKLPNASTAAASSPSIGKSDYKILKSACQNMFSSLHMWGLVIVTAGWDGRLRTYYNYGLPILP